MPKPPDHVHPLKNNDLQRFLTAYKIFDEQAKQSCKRYRRPAITRR